MIFDGGLAFLLERTVSMTQTREEFINELVDELIKRKGKK